MPCYRPNTAYYPLFLDDCGKRRLRFDAQARFNGDYKEINVPCQRCIGCRLEYSRQWAIRCMHEASLWSRNCFVTLTYNNASMPDYGCLRYRDMNLFQKRLRFHFGNGIRFFAAGEYGELSARPHYHMLIFNHDFEDKEFHSQRGDFILYRSPSLEKLWTNPKTGESYGYSSVGTLTFDSAAYVARYVTKKITGDMAFDHYAVVGADGLPLVDIDGEVIMRPPEKAFMSRRPGIGKGWYDKFKRDTYKDDTVILKRADGSRISVRPPKYYDNKFKVEYPFDWDEIKFERQEAAKLYSDNSFERLRVREEVKLAQLKSLKRTLD